MNEPALILGFPPRVFACLIVAAMIGAAAMLIIAKSERRDRK